MHEVIKVIKGDIPYLDLRRRVEFLQQSEVRSEIGAISAGIIDFVDRVFR